MIPQNKAKAAAYTKKQIAARDRLAKARQRQHEKTKAALEAAAREAFPDAKGPITMIICKRGRR